MTSHHQRSRHHPCLPVSFDVKMGRKYVIYVKKIAVGRYAAIAQPDVYSKKVRRAARKLLCSNCGMFFILYSVSIRIWQVLCTQTGTLTPVIFNREQRGSKGVFSVFHYPLLISMSKITYENKNQISISNITSEYITFYLNI